MAVAVDFARLEAERKRRGYTWGRVARLTGISPSAFTRWKAGTQKPDVDSLAKLADLFGLSIDQLVGRLPRAENIPPSRILSEREDGVLRAYHRSAAVRKIVDTVIAELSRLEGVPATD